ncbi:MAG: response regulator [Bacillota bacterium]|nr:response regulator [Bacillota bacterium]
MLRLLIADDEKYDRDSIKGILSSGFPGQLEISEARNGREAIEISERLRPDIVIMDIKMPGINGINAIQEIRRFLPSVYLIIITAYDYFDFAVEAVKNNVREYILKPFSKTELTEKVKEAVSTVTAERQRRQREIENQEKLYTLMPVLENEISYSIINDSIYSIDYETYMKYLDMDFNHACAMVVQVRENSAPSVKNGENPGDSVKVQIGEYIEEFIGRRYRTIASYRFTRDLVYFIQLKGYEDEAETRLIMINLASDIKRETKRFFDVSLWIGIGSCYRGLNNLNKSYKEACSSLEYKSENGNIVHYQDIRPEMSERMQYVDREKIALFKAVEQYILDNMREELDLETTAARFNLSSFYFSRTFKDVLGHNFSDYINIVRINKAKELLKSGQMSIKEICFSVGYSDPNYFSKVFKKYAGFSPTEYKIKIDEGTGF